LNAIIDVFVGKGLGNFAEIFAILPELVDEDLALTVVPRVAVHSLFKLEKAGISDKEILVEKLSLLFTSSQHRRYGAECPKKTKLGIVNLFFELELGENELKVLFTPSSITGQRGTGPSYARALDTFLRRRRI
jgi:hypothetical protein